MRLRKIAGATVTGALALGGLGALAAPAMAAPSTVTYDGAYTCSGSYSSYTFTMDYKPGLTVTADGTAVTATSVAGGGVQMAGGAALPAGFKLEGVDLNVVAKLNGESVTLKGSSSTAAGAGVDPSLPVALPALAGTRTSSDALTHGVISEISGGVSIRVPYGPPGGLKAPVAMTCTGTPVEIAAPPTAPAGGALFDCAIPAFKSTMAYPTTLGVSAKRSGGNVVTSVVMQDIPIKTIPVALDNTPIQGTAPGKVDGKVTSFTGSRSVTIPANTDIPVPTLSSTVATASNKVDIELDGVTFVAKHPLMDVDVTCTLASPVKVSGVDVAVTPAVAPTKKTTTKITSAKVKGKKVTVKGTVKAGKAKASGKATLVIKKGKKTVAKKTVTVKKGAFSYKSKSLKKGTHKVTVSFKASKTYKASSKSKTFKVK